MFEPILFFFCNIHFGTQQLLANAVLHSQQRQTHTSMHMSTSTDTYLGEMFSREKVAVFIGLQFGDSRMGTMGDYGGLTVIRALGSNSSNTHPNTNDECQSEC